MYKSYYFSYLKYLPSSIANVTDNLSADGAGEVASWAPKLDLEDFLRLGTVMFAADPATLVMAPILLSILNIPPFLSSLTL